MIDPHLILEDWLSGSWTRADGQTVTGRLWSPDAEYRWRRYLAHWFTVQGDDLWEPTGEKIRAWAHTLITWDTRRRLGPRSRARAVSVILSFYDHCEKHHGLGPFHLPPRWKIIGVIETANPGTYQPWVTDTLRTAADQFTGLPLRGRPADFAHPSRHRLACYLLLCGLRPKQAMHLDLTNLHPDPHNKTLKAKVPLKHHADHTATYTTTLPWPLWRAVEDFLPHRRTRTPHSGPHYGPVLTTRTGHPYDWTTFPRLLRDVAATHEDLKDITPPLRPDWIAHSPNPWTHTREDTDNNTDDNTDDNTQDDSQDDSHRNSHRNNHGHHPGETT